MQPLNDDEIMTIFDEITLSISKQLQEIGVLEGTEVELSDDYFTSLPYSQEAIDSVELAASFLLRNKHFQELKTAMHRALEYLPENQFFQLYLALGYYFSGETLVALGIGRALDFSQILKNDFTDPSSEVVCDCPGCGTKASGLDLSVESKVSSDVQALFREIHQHKHAGAYEKAIACYEAFFPQIGEPPCLLVDLADLYSRVKNYREAKKVYIRALKSNPDLYHAHRRLAATHRLLDEYELAVGALKKAHKRYPMDDMILLELSAGYYKLGHITKAIASLEKALVIDPSLEFNLGNMPDMVFLISLIHEKRTAVPSS